MGGTVVLEEGRRLESLGVTSPSSSSTSPPHTRPHTSRSRSATTYQPHTQPATPTIVPPTPTDASAKAAVLARRKHSAPVSFETSSTAQQSTPPLPMVSVKAISLDNVNSQNELHPRRRSLRKDGATSSTPDLAALVRRTKDRGAGGLYAGDASAGGPSVDFSARLTMPQTSAAASSSSSSSPQPLHLSPLLPPEPLEERKARKRSSTTSSSFSIVSSNSPAEERPSTAATRPKMTKAEKLLGVAGRPIGSDGTTDSMVLSDKVVSSLNRSNLWED